MKVEIEGDLFRVILRWKLKDGSEEPEETIQEGSGQMIRGELNVVGCKK